MNCPSCGHENRPGRKFCVSCGAALPRPCPACGADCEPGENFCGECGEPLGAVAPPRPRTDTPRPPTAATAAGRAPADAGARKVVTIVFADLVGSTGLHERVDAESARRLMERYYQALRGAVEAHGGTVVKLLGDGVMAAFGLHRVAEDDALRAVRGAAAMQEAFRELVRTESAALGSVGLRVAVNTGEVVVAAGEDDVVGDPVNVAARLQEQGRDGDVVLGEATRRLVSTRVTLAPLGAVALKGRAETVAAHRLVSLDPPAAAAATPFVGRETELSRLEGLFDLATKTPATHLAVLVGSPGLGKSRLIDEVSRRHADDATILTAHCDAAGGATFAPLAQALRRFLGLTDGADGPAVRAAVAAALTAGGDRDERDGGERVRIAAGIDDLLRGAPASPEETFFVVRRFLAALAAARPVLLVIDDLHWAEPLLLDLVEHLVQWGGDVPLFVLVGARPELRDLRSSLVTPGGIVGDVVTLGGLDAGAAMRLAAGVVGAADLPAAVAAKVLATSEGNPLFVGELVRMLVQEGALARDGDRWTAGANLAVLEMPPTIHALLAARIERLRPEERAVLERAAVVGRHFSRGAVAALLGLVAGRGADGAGDADVAELDARLESLRRSELIERDSGWFLGEPALRFHHVLIRDAAYRRLLKGTRAELHSQLAGWIEGRAGDAPEQDETIGRHLEQAHQLLGELGPLDAAAVVLGERAARRLAAAGRRAMARDDVSLAAGLLGRALALIGPEAPERADLVLDDCEALLSAGDVGPAAEAVAELDRIAGQASGATLFAEAGRVANTASPGPGAEARRLRAWHTCFAGQLAVLTAPEALHAVAQQVGAAAAELAGLEDAAGEAKAHFVHAQALARLGRIGASEAALDHALAAARRAGDRRRANAVLAGAPLAALWGPSPVTRASGRCLDVVRVLRITQGAPAVEAVALSCQGVLEALRGRIDAARRMLASSRTMVEELGIAHRLYESDVFAGRVDLLVGDASAAERVLRRGYVGLRDLGLGIDAARAAALLGRALLAKDRAAEAETLSHESELLAGDDLQAAIAWRGVRAEALARRGEHEAAIALAEAAVAIAAATDALLDHADARLALAAALRAGARLAEADAEERRAQELWEAKGATVLAGRARRDGPPVPAAPSRSTSRTVSRRFVPNRASEAIRTINVAMAEEIDRFRETLSEDYLETDHPTGVSYGREAAIRSVENLMRSTDALCRYEPLATLGETLGLFQRRVSASATGGKRFDVGAYENDAWAVLELDGHGVLCRQEVFADDRLSDAVVRLYERHAELLPEGPARERAARAAESYAAVMQTAVDHERIATTLESDIEGIDHRQLGSWSGRGADAFLAHGRALREVADNIEYRLLDVVALHPTAHVARVLHTGTDRAGGGVYERPFLRLFGTGPDGRLVRAEWFDDDREAEALARFDALVSGGEPQGAARRPVTPTPATASIERFNAAVAARDLEALGRELADDLEVIHHATGASYGRSGLLATWRSIFRARRLERRGETLAALGDHLALGRHVMTLEGFVEDHLSAVGAIETDETVLFEVDDDRRIRRLDIFPTERLGAALAQMFERSAGRAPDPATATRARGVAQFLLTFEGPMEADRVAAAYSASSVFMDRRLLGSWSAETNEDLKKHWRSQFVVADELTGRTDEILALTNDASLLRMTFPGTVRASGGRYENLFLALSLYDARGRAMRTELFDPGDRAAALVRFDEVAEKRSSDDQHPFANVATRAMERFVRANDARDWQAVASLFSPRLRFDDRRPLLRMELAIEGFLEQFRTLFDVPDSRWSYDVLATFGDRLSLLRLMLHGTVVDGGGDLEIEHLCLGGCDEAGLFETIILFEPGQGDDARAELAAVYSAAEGDRWQAALRFSEIVARRDWEAGVAMCAPGFVEHDHRSLALLGTSHDPAAWVNNFRVLVDLAPDTQARIDHIRTSPNGVLWALTWTGTRAGGAYEMPMVGVSQTDGEGRLERIDFYDLERADLARARFEELDATTRPVETFANAATRALERFARATAARDWETLADVFSPDLRFDDRRPMLRMTLGRDLFLQQQRVLYDTPNARWALTTLATCGESLSLSRLLLHGDVSGGGGALEIDHLAVIEAGDDGRICGVVLFEPDDLDAATAELDRQWLACGDIARHPEVERTPADRGTGRSSTNRAPVVDPIAALIRPSSATAAMERWYAAYEKAFDTGDWSALHATLAAGCTFEDRRRMALVSGGAELMVASLRERAASGARCDWTLIGGFGDRVVAGRVFWSGGPSDGRFEIEYLAVAEVDETGRILATVLFDVPDARDAQHEAFARWRGPDLDPLLSNNIAIQDAWNRKDLDGVGRPFAEDLKVHDRRHTGTGRLQGRDAYLRSVVALWELAPDSTLETSWVWLACTSRGGVFASRRSGTVPGGGEYTSDFLNVVCLREGLCTHIELFEVDEPEAALARFAELSRMLEA